MVYTIPLSFNVQDLVALMIIDTDVIRSILREQTRDLRSLVRSVQDHGILVPFPLDRKGCCTNYTSKKVAP